MVKIEGKQTILIGTQVQGIRMQQISRLHRLGARFSPVTDRRRRRIRLFRKRQPEQLEQGCGVAIRSRALIATA